MCADRIDHCGLLADEQLARAMQHQAALLLKCLGRNEPHVWPGTRLADGLGVSGIGIDQGRIPGGLVHDVTARTADINECLKRCDGRSQLKPRASRSTHN
jgi:hypothetical protein